VAEARFHAQGGVHALRAQGSRSLFQSTGDYFDAEPTFKQSYAPQSGDYFDEELKAAKEEETAAGQAQIDTKTQELAGTIEKKAQAKEKCQMTDGEWDERS
jgi:DsbC/DsbD-like thiol-disulfide interchange protein